MFIVHLYLQFLCSCFLREFFAQPNQIQIIFKQIYLAIDETLTGTTTPSQSEPGSNVNEKIFHTPQISRTKLSLLDAVLCHTQDTPFFWGGSLTPLQGLESM